MNFLTMCLDNLSIDFILLYSVKKKIKLNFNNLRDANFACNMENYDLLAFLEIFQCREIREVRTEIILNCKNKWHCVFSAWCTN